ncbi:MAG TPA: NnrU family protein [Parvibaculum sp.]
MLNLWAAAAAFLALHLAIAGSKARDRIAGLVGERAFLGLFSLASLGGIVWLCMAYNRAVMEPDRLYWVAPAWLVHLAPLVMIVAFFFAVIGLTTPNPTAAMAEGLLDKPDTIKGMLRITRHPFLWGAMIWATLHIAVNGDKASIIFFGTFLVLAALGTLSIDEKRKRKVGAKWDHFAGLTSNLPFAAIVAGRNQLAIGEIGWWRILAALIAFGGFFYGHLWLFGVSPVPGWVPY